MNEIDRDAFEADWTGAMSETAEKDSRVRGPDDPAPVGSRPEREIGFKLDKDRIKTILAYGDHLAAGAAGVDPRFEEDVDIDPADFLDLMASAYVPLAEKYGDQIDKSPEGLAIGATLIYFGSLMKDMDWSEEEESDEENEGPVEPEKREDF